MRPRLAVLLSPADRLKLQGGWRPGRPAATLYWETDLPERGDLVLTDWGRLTAHAELETAAGLVPPSSVICATSEETAGRARARAASATVVDLSPYARRRVTPEAGPGGELDTVVDVVREVLPLLGLETASGGDLVAAQGGSARVAAAWRTVANGLDGLIADGRAPADGDAPQIRALLERARSLRAAGMLAVFGAARPCLTGQVAG